MRLLSLLLSLLPFLLVSVSCAVSDENQTAVYPELILDETEEVVSREGHVIDADEQLHHTLKKAFFDSVLGKKSPEEASESATQRQSRINRLVEQNSELRRSMAQLFSPDEQVITESLETLECLVHDREVAESLTHSPVYDRLVELLQCRVISGRSHHFYQASVCAAPSGGRHSELAALVIGGAVQNKELVAQHLLNITLPVELPSWQIGSFVVWALTQLAEDGSHAAASRRALYALAGLARTNEHAATQIAHAMHSILPRLLQHKDPALRLKAVRLVTALSKEHLDQKICPLVSQFVPKGEIVVLDAWLALVEDQDLQCSRSILSPENVKMLRRNLQESPEDELETMVLRKLLNAKQRSVEDAGKKEPAQAPKPLLLG